MKFEGTVAIVTGAGSGIGRATGELFASEGARVTVAAEFPEVDVALICVNAYHARDAAEAAKAMLREDGIEGAV